MKIAQIITKPERGGAQTVVAELVAELQPCATNVVLTGPVRDDDYIVNTMNELGVAVEIIPDLDNPIRPGPDLRAFRQIRAALQRHSVQLVHSHSSKAGILGRLAARTLGIPAIFTAHGWAFTENAPLAQRLVGLVAEGALGLLSQALVTVSEYDYKVAQRLRVIQMRKVRTVYNGVPELAAPLKSTDSPSIVMVARFSRPKNQRMLVDAFATTPDLTKRGVRLQFVGAGPELGAVKQYARSQYPCAAIEFLGNRGDVPHILANAGVLALISDWEGLPMSIIEAMRAGLPVVASNVGGCSELVLPGKTGYVVPNEPAKIGRALVHALQNQEALGNAAQTRFEEHFTASVMAQRYWELYQAVANKQPLPIFSSQDSAAPADQTRS